MANLKAENNVFYNMYLLTLNVRKVLLICSLLTIFIEFRAAEECDFVKCIAGVRAYIFELSSNTELLNCRKLSNIPKCSEQCMHRYFPKAFSSLKEDQQSFTKYCEENISSHLNANWSCIARHTYRLLTCLVNVNSLTANNVREDMLTESCSSCLCRKYLEFPNCPKQVLYADCGKESSEVVKDLILFILNSYQPFSCKEANVKKVLSMPISYQLGSAFIEAAKPLDDHHLLVHTCLNQLIQDEIDLDGYICGEYNPDLSGCINYELNKTGKEHPDIKRLFLKITALAGFKCKQSSFEPHPISTSFSSEAESISKPGDYQSLKDGVTSDSLEISSSKNIKNDLKYSSELPTDEKTKTEAKSETAINDAFAIDKNIKIINVNDSVNKNSKKHINQNINSINTSNRINLHLSLIAFYFISLLFIFR